jgi:predicted Co/Zn/Cd cation transporter (cation efflux family)
MVRRTLLELSGGAPPAAIQQPVDEAVATMVRAYGFGEPVVRVAKVGPKLYVEVEATAPPETTVATEHEARELLRSSLAGLPFEVWLTVELKPGTA